MSFFARWLLSAAALYLTTLLGVGLFFQDPTVVSILFTALVLGLVNAIVRPIMVVLTLPLTLITFGLFLLVVNALAISIVASLTPLNVTGFGGALLGALVFSIINAVLSALVNDKEKD